MRPGKQTAEYVTSTLTSMSLLGSVFLGEGGEGLEGLNKANIWPHSLHASTLTSMMLLESVIHLSRILIPAAAWYAVQRGYGGGHGHTADSSPVHSPHIARWRLYPHTLPHLALFCLLSCHLKPHLTPHPPLLLQVPSPPPPPLSSH